MGRIRTLLAVLLLGLISCSGCANGPKAPPAPPPGSAVVSLAVTDTPPAGITVLAFQVTVTSAVLQPGNVQLVSTPTPIELKHLETDTALLSASSATEGTYNSITLSLANPVMTIENDSALGFTVGGVSCSPATICQFTPSSAGTLTFSAAPFPLTITANSPVGLLLDINLANLINSDATLNLSASNGMTVTQLMPVGGALAPIEDLVGAVANKDAGNNRFTLQRAQGNLVIQVDSNTKFTSFDQAAPACSANPQTFTCVANGQIVQLNAQLQNAGTLLATGIQFEDDANQEEAEGIVVGISPGVPPTQFNIVIVGETSNTSLVQMGNLFRVQYLSNSPFSVDDAAINTSGFSFVTASDLQVGQQILVRVRTTTAGTPPLITADRIKLRGSRFTGKVVGTPSGTTFNVNTLPTIFTVNGITQIQVQTSSTLTEFQNVSGVSGLVAGDTVSLRGPLFLSSGSLVLEAERVRKR